MVDSGTKAVEPSLGLRYLPFDRDVVRELRIGDQVYEERRPVQRGTGLDPHLRWWGAYLRSAPVAVDRGARSIRFVDLFSSVGGLSLGFTEAARALGFRAIPLFAADTDERALRVYERNFRPRQTFEGSVRDLVDFRIVGSGRDARFAYEPRLLDHSLSPLHQNVDAVLAGPPCQGHSSLNNHSRHEDPRNLLYLTVPAFAVAIGANHVVIENVPAVTADRHRVVQSTIGLLESAGYSITSGVLAADQLGWPQRRKRFFLVASRKSEPVAVQVVQSALAVGEVPVSWALADLADGPLDDSDVMNSVPKLSAENELRVRWLHEEDQHDLPNIIRPDCHKDGTTYVSSYGRMHNDRPAPTLTGGFLSPGRGRFVHPTLPRVLTPREAARIQGFPDWFSFEPYAGVQPSRTEVARWIGNAVPSIMGFAASLSAMARVD